MDIISLLTAGPSILRAVGSFFGGETEKVANTVANVADAVQGKSPSVQKQAMEDAVKAMPPEAQAELAKIANEALRIKAEMKARELEHEELMHHDTQETARVEAASDDQFVRRTRPKIARDSFAAGIIYAVVMEILKALGYGSGPDVYILSAILSPGLAYMGVRTIDAFSKHKGPKL